jgi:hypothetical protein
MEQKLRNYEIATWVLAVIVIILAILLIRSKTAPVPNMLEQVIANIEKCNADLAAWRVANPSPLASDTQAQEELSNILAACSGDVEENTEDTTSEETTETP